MPNAYHALNKCYLLYPLFLIFSSKINCAVLFLQQSLEICGCVFNKYLLTTHYVLHIVLGRDEPDSHQICLLREPKRTKKAPAFQTINVSFHIPGLNVNISMEVVWGGGFFLSGRKPPHQTIPPIPTNRVAAPDHRCLLTLLQTHQGHPH